MAPPVPGPRRPPVGRGRSAGDVLAGFVAVVALLALTVGVPFGLIGVFGVPIPHSMPSVSVFTQRLDALSILKVLSVLVWLAWLQLLGCVIAEIRAAVRNTGMPAQVPLAGGTQAVVHRLVTAALLLFSASTALSPAFAQHAPPRAQHSISAPARHASPAGAGQALRDARPPQMIGQPEVTQQLKVEKIYVVSPPEGRYHESLWEIAQNHLGDGRRYREIFELNSGRVQPDGSRLTIASLIRPGWVLLMPRDAHGPGIEVVTTQSAAQVPAGPGVSGGTAAAGDGVPAASGAAGDLAGKSADGAQAGHSAATAQAGHAAGGHGAAQAGPGAAAGNGAANGAAPQARAVNGAAPARPPAARPAGGSSASAAGQGWHEPVFPAELAAASLLAAGVLAALGRRRREQLWRRAFGRRVVSPSGEAAVAEVALRLGAHEPSVRLLDTGLRHLSSALAAMGASPPTVFAAHLGPENLDLWVAPPDHNPPSPWTAVGDGQVWRLPMTALQRIDPEQMSGALAPFPGLVSIGTDDTGRVLVDLEAAHGLIAITGPGAMVNSALSAIAVELATNRWSDGMQITLVGFGSELTTLAPHRVTSVRTLDEALPALEARAAEVAAAMAASGVGSVPVGRSRGIQPEAWAPHYVIMAVAPTPDEEERLLALAQVRHAAAAGYLVAGDVPGASWTWEVTDEGRLLAAPLGFDVQAQLLPARQHAAMVDLFYAATLDEGVALEPPPLDAAPAEQLVPGSAMPVEISLLGRLAVQAPGVIEPDRVGLATEIVVFLAAHPGGVHPNVLTGAIWPRGVTAEVREAALARATEWLGADGIGRPHLATDAGGRLRLGSEVRVDWQVFRALVAHADQAAAAGAPDQEAVHLGRALDLVDGLLLDGRDPGRYAWLATDDLEYEVTAQVADAAHRLSWQMLAAGDPESAAEAARAGLRLAFNDELLWRDLLRAAQATGQEQVIRAVVDEVCAKTALDEVLPRMSPETESLIDEVLPSWRSSVR
jgi:Bacterial transcriptional activator domain